MLILLKIEVKDYSWATQQLLYHFDTSNFELPRAAWRFGDVQDMQTYTNTEGSREHLTGACLPFFKEGSGGLTAVWEKHVLPLSQQVHSANWQFMAIRSHATVEKIGGGRRREGNLI